MYRQQPTSRNCRGELTVPGEEHICYNFWQLTGHCVFSNGWIQVYPSADSLSSKLLPQLPPPTVRGRSRWCISDACENVLETSEQIGAPCSLQLASCRDRNGRMAYDFGGISLRGQRDHVPAIMLSTPAASCISCSNIPSKHIQVAFVDPGRPHNG